MAKEDLLAGEELYVRSYLGSYCRPGEHAFYDLPSGRWCRLCYKEEPARGQCLVCDGPPEFPSRLSHVSRPAVALLGYLCRICYEAFSAAHQLDGWSTNPPRRCLPAQPRMY